MRVLVFAVVLLALAGCDEEPPPVMNAAAPPTATAPVAAAVPPSHGGTVVTAGPYPFEVVPHASGHVRAYLPPGVEPPAEAELRVDVRVEGRARPRPVRLRWDAEAGYFEGRVRRVAIVPGPLEVHFTVHQEVYVATAPTIVIAPAIEVNVVPGMRPKHRGMRYKHRGMRHKHRGMRQKHRKHRGGIEIEFR